MHLLTNKRDSLSSVHLDAVRGIAALFVLSNHLRALFFVEYGAVENKGAVAKILYLLTGLGHEAVMVFFVLSGFFISSSVVRSVRKDRWSWAGYAQNRLTRLYVVLIPALLLGLLWDRLGLKMFGNAGVYQGSPLYAHIVSGAIRPLTSASIWLGNLFFLQDIRVPTFGSNGPLWSLSYEFWYYLLFPIGILALRPGTTIHARILYSIVGLGILAFIGKGIAIYFLVWLMGAVIGQLSPTKASRSKVFLIVSGLAFAASLVVSRLHSSGNLLPTDFLIGVAFSAFMYALLSSPERPASPLYQKSAQFLSGISYTLYLVHVPLLVFLNAAIVGQHGLWQPTALHLGIATILAAGVLLYAVLVWRFTEAKTDAVRDAISNTMRKFAKTNFEREHGRAVSLGQDLVGVSLTDNGHGSE